MLWCPRGEQPLLYQHLFWFGPDDYWGAEGVIKYWHFVDVAWVIFPTLYLVS